MLILAIIIGKYLIRSANHGIRSIPGFRWFSDDAELAEYEIHTHGRIRANDIKYVRTGECIVRLVSFVHFSRVRGNTYGSSIDRRSEPRGRTRAIQDPVWPR